MERRKAIGIALLLLGAAFVAYPIVDPVEPRRVHDVSSNSFPGWNASAVRELADEEGIEVIYYSNLSGRAKVVYDRAVAAGGEYRTAIGDGAERFNYTPRVVEGRVVGTGYIVLHTNGSSPPGYSDGVADVLRTSTQKPPLVSPPYLLRAGSLLLGFVLLGSGGYLLKSQGG